MFESSSHYAMKLTRHCGSFPQFTVDLPGPR